MSGEPNAMQKKSNPFFAAAARVDISAKFLRAPSQIVAIFFLKTNLFML